MAGPELLSSQLQARAPQSQDNHAVSILDVKSNNKCKNNNNNKVGFPLQ